MSMALLSAYTSFGIGGEADIAVIHDLEDAAAVLKDDCIILGRGTNVLASDKGSGKKVVVNRLGTLTFDGEHVYAGSGVTLVTLCAACAERGLGNMEWACGIPGSVGGAVLMNAGAYGGWTYPLDFISQYDPDVIFCNEDITIPMLEQNANYKGLQATIHDIVYSYDFTAFERQGKRMFDMLEDMAKKAYPDAFADMSGTQEASSEAAQ